MGMNPQQRAAQTRAANKDMKRLYEENTKPAHQKVESVMNRLLRANDVHLKWVGESRLKGGVTGARLMAIGFGGLEFTVHIDGYSTPRKYASRFWEIDTGEQHGR